MPKISVNKVPEDFSEESHEITMVVSGYLDDVFKVCEKNNIDETKVISGVMSGVLTSFARFYNCPKCAGEILQDAGTEVVNNSNHEPAENGSRKFH